VFLSAFSLSPYRGSEYAVGRNIVNELANLHVLACPSIKEVSSIVVVEALSLGLLVICKMLVEWALW